MSQERLQAMLRHIITEIRSIPASDADLERVSTQMQVLLTSLTSLRGLDFSTVEIAGILQLEE
ncbi:MAG: hypothetical protein D6736_07835 [Nitrospinota bacterium]|nr:MAG: hypothetical protein D6736_07835 [Nitrospinota bacterium]